MLAAWVSLLETIPYLFPGLAAARIFIPEAEERGERVRPCVGSEVPRGRARTGTRPELAGASLPPVLQPCSPWLQLLPFLKRFKSFK